MEVDCRRHLGKTQKSCTKLPLKRHMVIPEDVLFRARPTKPQVIVQLRWIIS